MQTDPADGQLPLTTGCQGRGPPQGLLLTGHVGTVQRGGLPGHALRVGQLAGFLLTSMRFDEVRVGCSRIAVLIATTPSPPSGVWTPSWRPRAMRSAQELAWTRQKAAWRTAGSWLPAMTAYAMAAVSGVTPGAVSGRDSACAWASAILALRAGRGGRPDPGTAQPQASCTSAMAQSSAPSWKPTQESDCGRGRS